MGSPFSQEALQISQQADTLQSPETESSLQLFTALLEQETRRKAAALPAGAIMNSIDGAQAVVVNLVERVVAALRQTSPSISKNTAPFIAAQKRVWEQFLLDLAGKQLTAINKISGSEFDLFTDHPQYPAIRVTVHLLTTHKGEPYIQLSFIVEEKVREPHENSVTDFSAKYERHSTNVIYMNGVVYAHSHYLDEGTKIARGLMKAAGLERVVATSTRESSSFFISEWGGLRDNDFVQLDGQVSEQLETLIDKLCQTLARLGADPEQKVFYKTSGVPSNTFIITEKLIENTLQRLETEAKKNRAPFDGSAARQILTKIIAKPREKKLKKIDPDTVRFALIAACEVGLFFKEIFDRDLFAATILAFIAAGTAYLEIQRNAARESLDELRETNTLLAAEAPLIVDSPLAIEELTME